MTSSTSRTDAASSRSLLRGDILNPMRSPRSHVLTTYSGRQLDLDGCTSDVIFIEDIAAALSKICRFGAQSLVFYSVAQHAVLVQDVLITDLQRPGLSLYGLHHDSHEAFAGDLSSPLKAKINAEGNDAYKRLCEQRQCASLQFVEPILNVVLCEPGSIRAELFAGYVTVYRTRVYCRRLPPFAVVQLLIRDARSLPG